MRSSATWPGSAGSREQQHTVGARPEMGVAEALDARRAQLPGEALRSRRSGSRCRAPATSRTSSPPDSSPTWATISAATSASERSVRSISSTPSMRRIQVSWRRANARCAAGDGLGTSPSSRSSKPSAARAVRDAPAAVGGAHLLRGARVQDGLGTRRRPARGAPRARAVSPKSVVGTRGLAVHSAVAPGGRVDARARQAHQARDALGVVRVDALASLGRLELGVQRRRARARPARARPSARISLGSGGRRSRSASAARR